MTMMARPSSPVDSAVKHSCVVKNCFIELVDESPLPPLRRRRPSSLPPCALFDPERAGRSRLESYDIKPLQVTSTQSSNCSTRGHSPASSPFDDAELASISQDSNHCLEPAFDLVGFEPQDSNQAEQPVSQSLRCDHVGHQAQDGVSAAMAPAHHSYQSSVGPASLGGYGGDSRPAPRLAQRQRPGVSMSLVPGLVPQPYHQQSNTSGSFHHAVQTDQNRCMWQSNDNNGQELVSCFSQFGPSECEAPMGKVDCHVIWCDPRSFKDTSLPMKLQLEEATGMQVKVHKCAEKCIRPFRKRERSQKQFRSIILVAASSAADLLGYLQEAVHVTTQVIVLCDRVQRREMQAIETMARSSPFVTGCAYTWPDAVDAVSRAASSLR